MNQWQESSNIAVFGLSVMLVGVITRTMRDMAAGAFAGSSSPALLPETVKGTCTADQMFSRAKKHFGATLDPDEAGYILPGGTMLDFSERRWGGEPGVRTKDHTELTFVWPDWDADPPGGFEAMRQFMNWGAIRFDCRGHMIIVNLVKPPTEAQQKAVHRALRRYPDAVLIVEIDEPQKLRQIASRDFHYPFTNWVAFVERAVAGEVEMLPGALLLSSIPKKKDIDILDRLIKEKRNDPAWQKWPRGTTSQARKAVYKDILQGFGTLAEVKDYVKGLPDYNLIFTARGDEIPSSLIRIIIDDIERNIWLSPFRPERKIRPDHQPPLMPAGGKRKNRRTAYYVKYWLTKTGHKEDGEPYHWTGPKDQGAFKTLDAALRAATLELMKERPGAYDVNIYSREEEWTPDDEYPWWGTWEPIEGTLKTYDLRGEVVFDDKWYLPHAQSFKIREDIKDTYRGELFGTLWAEDAAGRKVGRLDFSIYQKDFHIKWIEVAEPMRRKGVAASLLNYVKSNYPESNIVWGMTTPEGGALKQSLAPASIPRNDLRRIADKYGWWAARLAESVCPHGDVACVEKEAKRLVVARKSRIG